jgi:hypothetical protein
MNELKRGLNGWVVEGSDDLAALGGDPTLFVARKGQNVITLSNSVIMEGMRVTDDTDLSSVTSWKLNLNGMTMAFARNLEGILKKAASLMEMV